MKEVWYVIILREVAHSALWNSYVYETTCGIKTAVVPADAIDGTPHPNAVYCAVCFPV